MELFTKAEFFMKDMEVEAYLKAIKSLQGSVILWIIWK